MGARRLRNPLGFFENRISNHLTMEEGFAALHEVMKLVTDGKLYELVVHEQDASIAIGYTEAEPLLDEVRALVSRLRRVAVAFVAPSDVAFGACRQIEMRLASTEGMELAVFRERPPAESWLLDTMARHAREDAALRN